jgi:hypothetical protein
MARREMLRRDPRASLAASIFFWSRLLRFTLDSPSGASMNDDEGAAV